MTKKKPVLEHKCRLFDELLDHNMNLYHSCVECGKITEIKKLYAMKPKKLDKMIKKLNELTDNGELLFRYNDANRKEVL